MNDISEFPKKALRACLKDFAGKLSFEILQSEKKRASEDLSTSLRASPQVLLLYSKTRDLNWAPKRTASSLESTNDDSMKLRLQQARVILILLTDDEQARLRASLQWLQADPILEEEPSIYKLLEAGMAFALFPDRGVFIDFKALGTLGCGIHMVCMEGAVEQLFYLKQRFEQLAIRRVTSD